MFSFVCNWRDNVFFPSSSQPLSFRPTALTLSSGRRHKETKNVTIKEFWCLDCTPGVLTAKQHCVTTVKCTFTFPFCWCFLSVWPCHPDSLCISQHVSFITLLFLSPSVFPSSISWSFLSQCLPLHTHRSSFIPVHPVILAIAVGVLSDPLVHSPGVEWGRWEMDRRWCGLRALLWGMSVCVCVCVWAGSNECDECVA